MWVQINSKGMIENKMYKKQVRRTPVPRDGKFMKKCDETYKQAQ